MAFGLEGSVGSCNTNSLNFTGYNNNNNKNNYNRGNNKPNKFSTNNKMFNYNNNISSNNNMNIFDIRQKNVCNMLTCFVAIWSVVTLGHLVVVARSATLFSTVDFAKPQFEPLCHFQQERFIESDGKESSLILEFNSDGLSEDLKSCTRILSAPSNYGFILRLILPKIHHHSIHRLTDGLSDALDDNNNDSEKPDSQINDMTTLMDKLNMTDIKQIGRSCPLSVSSSLDPHTPQWRLDPCQLEDTAPEMEDPVRLVQGRVRIVWQHNGFNLNSKLMVTALGKGQQCQSPNKHPCLQVGNEPILCISKALVCDGIRHCPNSNAYDSDEECWKKNKFEGPLPSAMESGLFEHFALEVFRNLFAFDIQHHNEKGNYKHNNKSGKDPLDIKYLNMTTTLKKVPKKDMKSGGNATSSESEKKGETGNTTTTEASPNGNPRRSSVRNGIHSDLSKYGPWGYLMLGMLLCGGALLICGLWASASQQAANNERESALANSSAGNGLPIEHSSVTNGPPNYEELDPPPAYSVLFPNQKSPSNATLNMLGSPNPNENNNSSGGAAAAAATLSPSRPACSGAANLVLSATNTQTNTTTSSPIATTTSGISSSPNRQDV